MRQTREQFEQVFRVNGIEYLLSPAFIDHKIAGFKSFEMLGNSGLAKLGDFHEFAHRFPALEERLDNPVPRSVSNPLSEAFYFFTVISHDISICEYAYMSRTQITFSEGGLF
jgi:hypothetical protein